MPKLEFDVKAKNYADAERQADELIATFVGLSPLIVNTKTVTPFDTITVDTTSMHNGPSMVPVAFEAHYSIDLAR